MRADRLLSILLLLQNQGRMTTSELAEKMEVSERTIHRDMDALSASGVPVFAERGSNGGWQLSEGYRTNLTGMKSEEIQSLLFAHSTSILSDLGLKHHYEMAFQKLLASSSSMMQKDTEYMRQRIHIDGAGWHQSSEKFPHLGIVQEAVWQEKKLRIQYQKEDAIVVERIVHPLGLVAKRGVWYLIARTDEGIRTYRISRITVAEMLEQSCDRPEDFNLADYWEQSTVEFKSSLPTYHATIWISKPLLPRITQERFIRLITTKATEDEHWIEAEAQFHTLESACASLLSFGPLAKVVRPIELIDHLKSQAQAIVSIYE